MAIWGMCFLFFLLHHVPQFYFLTILSCSALHVCFLCVDFLRHAYPGVPFGCQQYVVLVLRVIKCEYA